MTTPRALITGITGQDGSYLAEQLLAAGWEIHALVRAPIDHEPAVVVQGATVHLGDLANSSELPKLVDDIEPDYVFNLGGLSSVARSWVEPVATGHISGIAVLALLDASWKLQERTGRVVRFVQASSSEIFGDAPRAPQSEKTAIAPISPYGIAKACAHHAVAMYRAKGLHASSGILYNHESPRRPATFVTRKITKGVAEIAAGMSGGISLGNLDVKRDWGWAPDYVDSLVRMSMASEADDYVIATGESHSIREFVIAAFSEVGIADWEPFVTIDPRFFRPADALEMRGDASKAHSVLGWQPTVDFTGIVSRMVAMDVDHIRHSQR